MKNATMLIYIYVNLGFDVWFSCSPRCIDLGLGWKRPSSFEKMGLRLCALAYNPSPKWLRKSIGKH
jgi:hypothetical protein